MKSFRQTILAICVILIASAFAGCGADTDLPDKRPALEKIEYTNLNDSGSRELLQELLSDAGVSDGRIQGFFRRVDRFNDSVKQEWLTDGFEEAGMLYYGDVFTDHLVDDRSQYFKLPFNHRADIAVVPDWVNDAVVYNIFPDSFASGVKRISIQDRAIDYHGQPVRGKLGGTLWGIADNVDYLEELGVNCVCTMKRSPHWRCRRPETTATWHCGWVCWAFPASALRLYC